MNDANFQIDDDAPKLSLLGSSGIANSWISARNRGHWSKGEVKEYLGPPSHIFKVKFEEFKQGQADEDDGLYNLLGADFDWRSTAAPEPAILAGKNLVIM